MGLYKVLAATVIINCLVKGTLKSLGVLMLELDSLGVDTTTASWIPAIAYTLFSVMSTPVAKYDVVSRTLQIFLFQTGVVVVSQVHVSPGLSYHRLWCPPLLLASPPSPDPGSGSVSGHWRMCDAPSPESSRSTDSSPGPREVWLTGSAWLGTLWEVCCCLDSLL